MIWRQLMIKRLLAIMALGAALVACSPTDGGAGSPDTQTLAPVESMGTESAPVESMGTESASPAP
jgi:ABC-type glycerol-3-phosphate transport system substrate-binding protein